MDKKRFERRIPVALVGFFVTIAAIFGLWFLYSFTFVGNVLNQFLLPNYAEQVAKPIEEELIKAGATEVCSTGDKGFGIGNDNPWYTVFYKIPISIEKAEALAYSVSEKSGYYLKQGSPSNRGNLGAVADIFISKWYFDDSVNSQYSFLEQENIEFAMAVDGGEGRTYTCNEMIGSEYSTIGVRVNLKSFKRDWLFPINILRN